MKITWLGQNGFLLQTDKLTVIIDPYLSDSVEKTLDPEMRRKIPINKALFELKPDVMICTHNHLDHLDPDSIIPFLSSEQKIHVLCPDLAYHAVRKLGHPAHNYVLFNRGTECTYQEVTFQAVRAEHSDPSAVGIIVKTPTVMYYITGDTMYNNRIFQDIPKEVDVLFVVINGAGNNMNIADAYRFTRKISPKTVIPTHWGMFDKNDVDPAVFTRMFSDGEAKVIIPEPYTGFYV